MKRLTLVLLAPVLLYAAPPLPIEWEMTTAAFGGRKAIVKLDSGARIEGVWLDVTPTTFTIDVDRTKGKNGPPKGVQTLERSSIVELRLQERRIRGRVIGTLIGYFGGMPLAYQAPSAAVGLPVLIAMLTTSHLLGRASDKTTRVVYIKPESPPDVRLKESKATESQFPLETMGPQENEGKQ